MLKPTTVNQKWILPSFSSSMRPVIFGNQKYTPAVEANTTVPNRV